MQGRVTHNNVVLLYCTQMYRCCNNNYVIVYKFTRVQAAGWIVTCITHGSLAHTRTHIQAYKHAYYSWFAHLSEYTHESQGSNNASTLAQYLVTGDDFTIQHYGEINAHFWPLLWSWCQRVYWKLSYWKKISSEGSFYYYMIIRG